jgi:hypothetical protein
LIFWSVAVLLARYVRTIVYIDGFNLYFGCLKGTPYRWLNLWEFAQNIAPGKAVVSAVRYFTARVTPLPGWAETGPVHQAIYLRAVTTLAPNVSVHLGEYRAGTRRMPLHPRPSSGPQSVTVLQSNEKGSDVNLAAHLLLDGFRRKYEQAIVVSNDTDLATPIRMVRDELKLPIGVVFPCTNENRRPNKTLKDAATFWRAVREPAVKRSLFLNNLTDKAGAFSKPSGW